MDEKEPTLAARREDERRPAWRMRSPLAFRGDIDGLRALAIILIVAFHVGLPWFDGGFIGVDVFFVISGYLITSNLLRDDRVHPITFWAKRLRRLVPALALMVFVTVVVSVFVVPAFDLSHVAREGASAALYVSNIVFARASQGYFATDVGESPFLHTWSLGVEEQFYVIWPIVVLGCGALVSARRMERRGVLAIAFGVILVASFVWNLRLTEQGSTWAFFGLPTRAWEFAAAGLLAVVASRGAVVSVGVRTAMALIGVLFIAAATIGFDAATPYPGSAALVPVAGTMLLIAAGDTRSGSLRATPVSRSLSTAPAQWVGRVSYSWYLWHWPMIVLATLAIADRVRVRFAAAALSLGVAYVTYRLVENPIRFSAPLVRSNARTFALGAVGTVVVTAVALVVASRPNEPAAGTLDAQLAALSVRETGCEQVKLPNNLTYCQAGDVSSDVTVMLVGDSHGLVWIDALGQTAEEQGVRLVARTLPGCPAIPVRVRPQRDGATSAEKCADKREADRKLMERLRPDAVILSQSDGYLGYIMDENGSTPNPSSQIGIWSDAYRDFVVEMRASGVKLGVLRDNPILPESPKTCIARHRDTEPCELDRRDALADGAELRAAGRAVLDEIGEVPTLELIDVLCDHNTCALDVNGVLAYTDTDHMSQAVTLEMKPRLAQLLRETVDEAG